MAQIRSWNRRLTIALLLLGFGLIATLALIWRTDQVLEDFELEAASLTERLQTELDNAVLAGTEDLIFLVESPEARGAASGKPGAIDQLESLFLAYVQARSQVFQARLLDADGHEMLRIERGTDRAPARATRLQNKAKRYYFKQATMLKRGEVFVSELDLNIEDGKLEAPFRPTLRFATPLFTDSRGPHPHAREPG